MADKTDSSNQKEPLINSTSRNPPKINKSISFEPNTTKSTPQSAKEDQPKSSKQSSGKSRTSNAEKKKPIREDLSIDQIDELFESFSLLDKDYDGAISKDELSTVMKSIGLNATEAEIKEMVDEADTKDKDNIDFPEFLTFLARKTVDFESQGLMIKQIFEVFKNPENEEEISDDSVINSDDLLRILREFNEQFDEKEIKKLLKESSFDGKSTIGKEELLIMLESDKNKISDNLNSSQTK